MKTEIEDTELQQLRDELEAYRNGGLTEEILRRKDGYIKVGRGCVLISETTLKAWQSLIKRLIEQLKSSTAEIKRLVSKAAPVGDIGSDAEEAMSEAHKAIYGSSSYGATAAEGAQILAEHGGTGI